MKLTHALYGTSVFTTFIAGCTSERQIAPDPAGVANDDVTPDHVTSTEGTKQQVRSPSVHDKNDRRRYGRNPRA